MSEEIDNSDFWNNYKWNWASPDDVKQFVDDATEREVYEYAWGTLEDMGGEGFYTTWWYPLQNAIKDIAENFSQTDLKISLEHLLQEESECDPAIIDAILKFIPSFPKKYSNFDNYIDGLIPESWLSDWWEFSWYPFIGAYFTWTFWGPETLARSTNIDPKYLSRVFNNSIVAENPYRTFRARVALASNPNCPKEIIEFLWANRDSQDWLLRDYEEVGALSLIENRYEIDESVETIDELRDEASQTLDFTYPTDDRWDSGPGAEYVGNLLDIEWEADSAATCLLAAFAKNPSLDQEMYSELSKESHPLVRYFLSKNSGLPRELKVELALESPTFTYSPYGSHPNMTEDITLK
jgi:hypothetical protein